MNRLLSLNNMLDFIYTTYKKNMGRLIGYSLLMMFIVGIIGSVVSNIIGVVLGILMVTQNIALIVLVAFVMYAIITPIYQVVAVGPNDVVLRTLQNKEVTFSNTFSFAFKKLLKVYSASLAFYLCFYGIVLLIAGIYYGFYVMAGEEFVSMWVLISVGIILGLIMLGSIIVFSTYSVYFLQEALYNNKLFFASIIGSFKLVRGHFKETFWQVCTSFLSIGVVQVSLGSIMGIIIPIVLIGIRNMDQEMVMGVSIIIILLMYILYIAGIVIVTPISYLVIPTLYVNARNKYYGYDLAYRLGDIKRTYSEQVKYAKAEEIKKVQTAEQVVKNMEKEI